MQIIYKHTQTKSFKLVRNLHQTLGVHKFVGRSIHSSMEANRKRSRGFLKGKLTVPFYRQSKPPANTQFGTIGSTKTTKPNQSTACPNSVGIVVHQDYAIAQPKPKVTFVVADNCRDLVSQLEEVYGVVGDESVDSKAALYISTVQERLKLERVNSERKKFQENQV